MATTSPLPLRLRTCSMLEIATGVRVRTLAGLVEALEVVADESLLFHAWSGLLRHRLEAQVYRNGFANWARFALGDEALAERLSVLEPALHPRLELFRAELIGTITDHVVQHPGADRRLADRVFHFVRPILLVYELDRVLEHPVELPAVLVSLPASSLYLHFVASRYHEDGTLGEDDLSRWLAAWGEEFAPLVERWRRLIPSYYTLEELRRRLVETAREFLEVRR